jgi:hypothetical protein
MTIKKSSQENGKATVLAREHTTHTLVAAGVRHIMPSASSARAGGGHRYDAHGHARPLMSCCPSVDGVRMWGRRAVAHGGPARRAPHGRQAAGQRKLCMRPRGRDKQLRRAAVGYAEVHALGTTLNRRQPWESVESPGSALQSISRD